MMEAYSDCEGALFWREAPICKQLQIFPEGQICLIVNGSIAGYALLLIVDCTNLSDNHTYGKITVNHTLSTMTPIGMDYPALMFLYTPGTTACALG